LHQRRARCCRIPDALSAATAPSPWNPGLKVGRYVLLAPLATGGMAELWLARQPGVRGFEKLVVVKRMIGALQDDPENVEMFLSEARLAAGLSHRHVVQIYELGEEQGSFYIVMEFIEGESLARVFKASRQLEKPIPVAIAVQLVAWAAEGLHYAHTSTDEAGKPRGIIHRDVSPQNLLLTSDGSIKLVDFGIAKVATEETSSGKLKGKITYMPPEQARAEQLDPRADVFSLAVVLFELVTGTRLFGKATEIDILNHLIQEKPMPRCTDRQPAVPSALDAIVAKAMAPSREQRFASAREFQTALENWLSASGLRASSADIADYLNHLLPERHAERRAMLEAARKGEMVPAALAEKLAQSGSGSMSDPRFSATKQSDLSVTSALPGRALKSRTPMLVAAALGVLVLGVVAFAFSRGGEVPPPVVVDAGVPERVVILDCVPKASVSVDGSLAGVTPLTLKDLAPGEHELTLNAPGSVGLKQKIMVTDGRLERSFTLEKTPAPPPEDAGVVVAVVPKPTVAHASGKLNLRTTPWTTVYFGKKKLGDTPLVGVTLPAGPQVLRVENAEAGVKSSIEVTIKAGQTVSENLAVK
jgi:eukaryotic-like serine/threonine-protein kinase